eukprot:UN1530
MGETIRMTAYLDEISTQEAKPRAKMLPVAQARASKPHRSTQRPDWLDGPTAAAQSSSQRSRANAHRRAGPNRSPACQELNSPRSKSLRQLRQGNVVPLGGEDHGPEPWVLYALRVLAHILRDVCVKALGERRGHLKDLLRGVARQALLVDLSDSQGP